MTPFVADLTGLVQPGKNYQLRVKAYARAHYGMPPNIPIPFDFNKDVPAVQAGNYNGDTNFPYGLTGYVRLVLLPPVYISDIFVRPSVTNQAFSCDAWITNNSGSNRQIELNGAFSSWNKQKWDYPTLPNQQVDVPAGQTVKASWSGVSWNLGEKSYWWPNIPFHEDYVATLHWLNLSLSENGRTLCTRRQRFGFVEHAEGPFYYTVNGVRYTSFGEVISYGQVGEYDCWTETPCFQPPHDDVKGCPDTWKRYQRIGFNSMRLSTSVPTEYMLETADEAGYMLIPEGASWGNGTSTFDRNNFSRQLGALMRTVRNHPCVSRYSLANESLPGNTTSPSNPWRWLIDDALPVDPTRPYVFEVDNNQTGVVQGMNDGHAYQMQHYDPIVPGGDHIRGMGECAWTPGSGGDGMEEFAQKAVQMRLDDWAHFAPWDWVNFWPNFLEGMNHDRHPWKNNDHADRVDGVDGWNSPIVESVQRALNPYLVVDRASVALTPGDERPIPIVVGARQNIERKIEVFNGGLTGNHLTFVWSGHWDKPDGELAIKGDEIDCEIEPGFHATQTISFTVPLIENDPRKLFVVMESRKEGKVVFREDGYYMNVYAHPPVTFMGGDDATHGNWSGKYGSDGYDLIGQEAKFPGDVKMDWQSGQVYTYNHATQDDRALAGVDPAGNDEKRVAAAVRYGSEIAFTVDAGATPRRLSLYFLDFDRQGRQQEVELQDAQSHEVLDEREISDFSGGRYLSWLINNPVKVTIRQVSGENACIAGVFLDPAGDATNP